MLEPLGPRPDAAAIRFDEDAGPEIPDGAVLCKTNSDCDDGIACTHDLCEPQGYCRITIDGTLCSDGLTCNGIESCDPAQGGCVSAPPPDCDDNDPCTIDSCDETVKDCVHAPRDFDRDGEADYHCPGGTDCDDSDAKINTQAAEICGDGIDNDCDGMIDESNCGSVPYDTCASTLDVSAGGTFELSMVGAVGDYLTSCDQMGGTRDVVLSFKLDSPRDVKLQANGVLSDGTPEIATLALQTTCGDMGSELQCANGFPGDLRVRALAAGQYFLVVSSSYAARTVNVTATFSAPTKPPTNTLCANAIDVGDGGHFEGNFVGVGDNILSSCTVTGQPDVFYKFATDDVKDVEISATGSDSAPVSVSLHKSCAKDGSDTIRCDAGQRVLTRLHQLDKGTYILVVEGPATNAIDYTLDVAITSPTPAPQGDTCMSPLTIAIGDTQRISLEGLQADITSSCHSHGSGADAALTLHVPAAQDLEISLDGDGAVVSAALQTACGMVNSEKECRAGMPLDTRIHDVTPGDYFLVVESATATALTLQVTGQPLTQTVTVSGNDTCYTATDIPADGGSFSGDTSQLQQDYSASCGTGVASSKDAAFRLVLTARKHVVASIDAVFDSVLLRYASPKTGNMLCSGAPAKCNDDPGMGKGGVLDELLDAGTYYYIVNGYKDFNAGNYVFDVSVTDP